MKLAMEKGYGEKQENSRNILPFLMNVTRISVRKKISCAIGLLWVF